MNVLLVTEFPLGKNEILGIKYDAKYGGYTGHFFTINSGKLTKVLPKYLKNTPKVTKKVTCQPLSTLTAINGTIRVPYMPHQTAFIHYGSF